MLYFIFQYYEPGTAVTNRALAYAKGVSELGVDSTFLFIHPDKCASKVDSVIPHVKFAYLWNKFSICNNLFRWIIAKLNLKWFLHSLKSGDKIYLYNNSELIDIFLANHHIKVYHERTEHPMAHSFLSTRFRKITITQYYDSCRKVDGLFVISSALKRHFIKMGVCGDKIEVVNMIVDSKRFDGLQKRVTDNYICYCGTASNNKDGVDELLKAFAIFHKRYPAYKLYIIGKIPLASDESQNLKLMKDLEIEGDVFFTGLVTPDKIPQILKNAAILALDRPDSLQAQYGFPTKLGEYLLSENPVVVTKVGDIPEFFEDGVNAMLAEERNTLDFANKMIWLVEHPVEAVLIGRKGAEVARKYFNNLIETKKIINYITMK